MRPGEQHVVLRLVSSKVCPSSFGTALGWKIEEPFEIRFSPLFSFLYLQVLNWLSDLPKDSC